MEKSSIPVAEGVSEQGYVSPAGADFSRIIAPYTLTADALYQRCDISKFTFTNTAELQDLTELIGQDRALKAVEFGAGIDREGFNLFLLGPSGTGKFSTVRSFLEKKAASESTPDDWCYINNFKNPEAPTALKLPAGLGTALRQDLLLLVENLRSAIPSAFQTESYTARKHAIEQEVKDKQEKAFEEIQRQAREKGVAVLRTHVGIALAPLREDEVIGPEEFEQLPQSEREKIDAAISELQAPVQAALHRIPKFEQEGRAKIRLLNQEVATFAVGHLIDELRKKYSDLAAVVSFLNDVQEDITENVDEFLSTEEHALERLLRAALPYRNRGSAFFQRYNVNLLVDHSAKNGAPVVFEDHPTYANILGQIEYVAHLGAVSTDFNLIRPGALHQANGGYLILDAYKLLLQPYAWEAVKRSLKSSQIRIESLGQMLGLISAASLEPQPIPLHTKIVLVGERLLYYLLCSFDLEFSELFKVAADFEVDMDRTPEADLLYARLIGTIARQEKLLPFDPGSVGRIIEQCSRCAGDSEKVLTHRRRLADLLREADYWARVQKRALVLRDDVQHAIDAQIYRSDRIRQRLMEETLRGTLLVDTAGEQVGQVNGLSVIDVGNFAFGYPSRITARVRLGKGEVIDIEREVELSGPIHSKGVLIVSGFLGARYAPDHPLSLSASLVFEQSYGAVEGDSASLAELYALLSALSALPIKQAVAVTGSFNQHGHVQPVGGINEKIEGFFDLCKERGAMAGQGVIIPASNKRHLMLKREVVDAVQSGKFHVYAIESVDQGMEILTGIPAGERDESGQFPKDSVNGKVEQRLIELAKKRLAFTQQAKIGTVGE